MFSNRVSTFSVNTDLPAFDTYMSQDQAVFVAGVNLGRTYRPITRKSLRRGTRASFSHIATSKMGINRVVQFQFKADTSSDAIEKASIPMFILKT
ncbi:hypothetical protein J7337_013230 [Fusarium musae]|uniref:Uncharacterized protein n=1 Tax=Fusarium musae TaxID=1042133 RepID=A0A9P8D499_9HYPO|nr:hypothetical protein J7337_013230 [Fusarium musae]KAG9495001.1 hypothetical protein J7337_013230 [Fusarium musae]